MGLRKAIIVVLLAVLAYFCLRPTDVVLNSSIFIYRDPKFVYSKASDMSLNTQHQKYAQGSILTEDFVREDGVRIQNYEVTEHIPLGLFDWKYSLTFNTVLEHTRPGHQFSMHYHIWYAGVSGRLTRTLTPKDEDGGPGCLIEQEYVIGTPWITSHYIRYHAAAAHADSLHHMKLTIESMHEYFDEQKQ